MNKYRPITKDEYIVGYASQLAYELFQNVTRDTGLPYTHDHLAQVAMLVGEITIPSRFQNAVIAAAWLHDSVEDILDIEVYDPFSSKEIEKREEVVYLNNLLSEAGDIGEATCFIINLVTHRKDTLYQDYVYNIFSFPKNSAKRDLHILTSILKMADRRKNLNPDERKNVNYLVKEYFCLEDSNQQALEEFYRRTKTIDAFRRKGDMNIDIGLFVETLMEAFMAKQRAAAIDNLSQYLPLAEQKLVVEINDNNGLFDKEKMRRMLKDMYIDSLQLYPGNLYDVKKIGINKTAPKIPGYNPIIDEIRDELVIGLHDDKFII